MPWLAVRSEDRSTEKVIDRISAVQNEIRKINSMESSVSTGPGLENHLEKLNVLPRILNTCLRRLSLRNTFMQFQKLQRVRIGIGLADNSLLETVISPFPDSHSDRQTLYVGSVILHADNLVR